MILGFLMFAVDQAETGREHQVAVLQNAREAPSPSTRQESVRERENSNLRELIDDANDELLSPFADLVDSNSPWVERGLPAALALLVYGLGGLLLANFLPKPRHKGHDWREVPG